MKQIQVIDFFCGIGGLTYGLEKAGVDVVAGLDNDESCRFAYEKNNNAEFIGADIAAYDFAEMDKMFSKQSARVLVGCAPCQLFSSHSNKTKDKKTDVRWHLINHFVKAIERLNPDVVSMENVRGLTRTDVFEQFLSDLKRLGYQVDHKVVYCPDYGIPQNRSRLILLGSRLGKISVPQPTHCEGAYVTVADTIRALPAIKAGTTSSKDRLHRSLQLTPTNIRRIQQSVPNGTWKDWDRRLLPECFKKEGGQSYTPVYGRMAWDDVAPTITTQFYNYGSGRFGHPSQDRALSLREGALLQTFPRSYNFGPDDSASKIGRHIGNAVPPRLGYVIGKAIKGHIKECYGESR